MNEDRFESRLEALFAQPPAMDDTAAFAVGVERRLHSAARWRSDLSAVAWIVTGGAALFALTASLDSPVVATATAQAWSAVAAFQDAGGGWVLPVLAICGALAYLTFEDTWARD